MADSASKPLPFDISIELFISVLVGAFFVSSVISYLCDNLLFKQGLLLRNNMRVRLYSALLFQPIYRTRQLKIGELSARCSEDIGRIHTLIPDIVAPLFKNSVYSVGCLYLMFSIHVQATLVVMLIGVLGAPVLFFFGRRTQYLASSAQSDHSLSNALFEESLVAIREIKSFVREALEVKRYSVQQDKAMQKELLAIGYSQRFNQIIYILVTGLLLATFYVTTHQMSVVSWTVGDGLAFYMYAYTLAMSLLASSKLVFSLKKVLGPLESVWELIETGERDIEYPQKGKEQIELKGTIEFRDVDFGYGQTLVIRNCSFKICAGEWVVIRGPSGSGKSTLAQLMIGLYHARSGQILIDGDPIERLDIAGLRKQVGYVGQEPLLFHGTLRENICLSDWAYSEERLSSVIEIAGLDEMIPELPDGLKTIVGERGYTLSGGQKSRIAIARAIMIDPPVLILDEANSMLETSLERQLWDRLSSDRRHKTTIIISHHTENIIDYDRLVTMETGIALYA